MGLVLYVVYRRADETSLLRRVTVSPRALRAEPPSERDYGSILVPLFGTELDDDIVQTAARLVAGEPTDEAAIDAAHDRGGVGVRDPDVAAARREPARGAAQARTPGPGAREGRWRGVHRRARRDGDRAHTRAGYAIVDEARRRGVEAIVLGAEEPSLIRGGGRLGGRGGPLEGYVGDITKYVVRKASCRVIVTAPAARDAPVELARRVNRAGAPMVNLRTYVHLLLLRFVLAVLNPPPAPPATRMFVLIVGAGRVGAAVAKSALAAGHEVSVLDEDPLSHERLDAGQSIQACGAAGSGRIARAFCGRAALSDRRRQRD